MQDAKTTESPPGPDAQREGLAVDSHVVASLDRHEETIRRGLKTFIEVGNALAAIHDGKLYLAGFGTFEAYVQERWKWTRKHAYRLIEAAEAASAVSHGTQLRAPSSERQARELAKAPAADRPKVWAEVVEESETTGKPITAKAVEAVVLRSAPDAEAGDGDEWEEVDGDPEPSPCPGRRSTESSPASNTAMQCGRMAISQLERIPVDHPQRQGAIALVATWIEKNS